MSFFYRRVVAPFFPSILWHTNDAAVHLTFDDGPHPSATPIVLDILKSRQLRATFFLLGENVKRFSDLAREIVAQGHSLGNHSFVHSSLLLRSFSWQAQQVYLTNEIIREATGTTPRLFRPPFGRFNQGTIKAASSHGLKTVMWDVDSKDFAGSDIQMVVRRVCQQTIGGSIVLFHDNESTAKTLAEYLNLILDDLERRNMKFSSLVL